MHPNHLYQNVWENEEKINLFYHNGFSFGLNIFNFYSFFFFLAAEFGHHPKVTHHEYHI